MPDLSAWNARNDSIDDDLGATRLRPRDFLSRPRMNTHAAARIRRAPNLTDQVTDALRADIRANTGGPGSPLPSEQAMATAYGVSRTVMREALSRLKADGLIVSRQGLGAVIAAGSNIRPLRIDAIDRADAAAVMKIAELRAGCEVEATALAAERRTQEDLREMKAALDEMARAVREGDVEAGSAADFRFHQAIYAATGNEYILRFFEFIQQFYRESLTLSRAHSARDKRRESQAHDEHTAVYQAIRARDADRARSAARMLLANTVARMIEASPRPLAANSTRQSKS